MLTNVFYACKGCGNVIQSDDRLQNAWHPACWVDELKRRWRLASSDREREALERLGKGAASVAKRIAEQTDLTL